VDTRKNRSTAGNRRLAKKRVQCLNEALYFVSSSVLADSLVLRNPLLRQAPKRCASVRSRTDADVNNLIVNQTFKDIETRFRQNLKPHSYF
jgi:hypothetical protein